MEPENQTEVDDVDMIELPPEDTTGQDNDGEMSKRQQPEFASHAGQLNGQGAGGSSGRC